MRIGLIAMSGIRCCDAELLELGLTLPGFVERSKTIASLPSLGLLTLAGMVPKTDDVEYVEIADIRDCDELPGPYDLVGISSYSAQIAEAYELGDRYKAAGVPVVMGGPHVTALPDEAAEHCNVVVRGEGEAAWPKVLDDARAGRVEPMYDPGEDAFDLADAPGPAFELLQPDRYNRLLVQTSRGCPHRCEFCASSVMIAEKYKQKPAEKVQAELDRIESIWPHPFIEFADDNSFVDKDYWKGLLKVLQGRGFKWFAETDLSVAEDDELLELMRSSGCAQVLIGLESPTPDALDGLETRGNWKRKHFDEYRDAIANIQGHGITVNGCFVLGLDAHGPEIFDEVFDFVKETELFEVQVTVLTPFPGTPLYRRLASEKRLLDERAWDKCTLFDVNYQPAGMSPEELTEGFRKLVVRLYGEEFTKWRRRRFHERRKERRG